MTLYVRLIEEGCKHDILCSLFDCLPLQKYDVEQKSPAAKDAQAASEDWCPVYK